MHPARTATLGGMCPMENPLRTRGLALGQGRPKIALPLVAATSDELCAQAAAALAAGADLVEWRADAFAALPTAPARQTGAQHPFDAAVPERNSLNKGSAAAPSPANIVSTLALVRDVVGELPLLFTFRTPGEGGEGSQPGPVAYEELYRAVLSTGHADLVDIELSRGEALCRKLVNAAHAAGALAVLSSHDFEKTPDDAEMLSRLRHMRALGADLPKLAVWPQSEADVLRLLAVCEAYTKSEDGGPLIAISMGKLGRVSRVAAGLFGSVLTFAALPGSEGSAPGQLETGALRSMLDALYPA